MSICSILFWAFYRKERVICDWYPEIIDLNFVPLKIKNTLQDVMAFKWHLSFNTFDGFFFPTQVLKIYGEVMNKYSNFNLLALAAGGEGMEVFLCTKLIHSKTIKNEKLNLILSDYNPNVNKWEEIKRNNKHNKQNKMNYCISYIDQRLDMFNMSSIYNTKNAHAKLYTTALKSIAASTHHFDSNSNQLFLEEIIRRNDVLIITDINPSLLGLLLFPINGFLFPLLYFIYLILTQFKFNFYLLFCPFIQAHDVFISVLRARSANQWKYIIKKAKGNELYNWRFEKTSSMLVLVAEPKKVC